MTSGSYDTLTNRDFRERVKSQVDRLKGKRDQLLDTLEKTRAEGKRQEQRHEDSTKARAIVQKVAQETQKKLEYHVANLVTLAEAAVFPEPYEFGVEFVQRRNRTECDLFFIKGGERMDPIASSGGGALDVASFALRCAFWSLHKSRPVLILDEPFKFLSVDLQSRAAEMVKKLSTSLEVQFIITSHLPGLIESMDKRFEVTIDSAGVSRIEEVE